VDTIFAASATALKMTWPDGYAAASVAQGLRMAVHVAVVSKVAVDDGTSAIL
jgi:hypothetical protein